MLTTAIKSALLMYGLAMIIAMLVAGLIKLLFTIVRRFGGGS